MIYGFTHPGSGLGNQLHRYVATRVLALDKGYDFSIIGKRFFKGSSFMNIDFGKEYTDLYQVEMPSGKIIPNRKQVLWEEKTNYYNPDFNFVEDNTIIDGEFQSIQYFGHRLKEIDEWIKVKPIDIPDDLCIIGFRGGEYYLYPELGLPKEYFDQGIEMMRKINPKMNFVVHTDDGILAKKFFPDLNVIRDIEINWRSIRYAKHVIISNSSFYILPRLLNGEVTIAPRYWARRNVKEWSRPDNYYSPFIYI